ncbi:MAG: hypothetical protein ACHQO8_09110 [Vicinamibacterales bacterium]
MPDGSYSPRLRTGVILCGAGTAGAYQAGVLKALTEAGVKIDLLAGHGAGAMTALCGAIDGGARLWDATGPWADPRLRQSYRWRPALRLAAAGLVAAALILAAPLVVLVFAAVMYAASLLVALANLPDLSARLVNIYRGAIEALFNPPWLPTIVPRALVLALLAVFGVLLLAATRAFWRERSRRRLSGAFWWRLIGAPLDAGEPTGALVDALWRLVRGASSAPRPVAAEIGRRYIELLTDNLGQPGFRETLIAVHDLDARRDLVGAVLSADARRALETRRDAPGRREAEVVDLSGSARDLVVDFLAGAQQLPVASAPHLVQFPADSYWRGELHRLCDRPELASRLVEEASAVGIEQAILVGAAAPPAVPHGMRAKPVDLRGRMGEVLRSIETAVLQDAASVAAHRFSGVFVIRPEHNPVGPFDFGGAYDEASDRQRTVAELMQQGYSDAYRQFVEPVVAAGDKVEAL